MQDDTHPMGDMQPGSAQPPIAGSVPPAETPPDVVGAPPQPFAPPNMTAPMTTATYPVTVPQIAADETPVAAAPLPVGPPAARPAPRRSTGAVIAAGLIGGIIGAAIAVGAGYYVISSSNPLRVDVDKTPTTTNVQISTKAVVEPAVAVAKKDLPSVVNVTIYQQSPLSGSSQPAGNGSGVVYKPGGYIITNNHVVEGADRITVKVGTEEIPAKVVGRDPKTDIAVIKIARDLPPIPIGDSSKLDVGQSVIAVGSPFGLDKTVTEGIVSALNRAELGGSSNGPGASSGITAYTNLIQTDAAINPGNSGGALVDVNGDLVGINTLIAAPAQQSAGVGFAIPVNTVTEVADQLIKKGSVDHAYLGVSSQSVTPDVAVQSGKGAPQQGAAVVDVVAGSPAVKAGIKVNDIILKVADKPITSADDLILAIRSQKIGAVVPVQLWRSGQTITLDATIGSDRSAP